MKKAILGTKEIRRLKTRYRLLASKLGDFESLSQGSVLPQPPRAWRWTRKVQAKTVTRGLSPSQAEKMKQAIANHRALDKIIDEMREITQKLILETPENTPISRNRNHPKTLLS